MAALLFAAVLIGPGPTEIPPSQRCWIIYRDGDFHSDALRSEWKRDWQLRNLRYEIEGSFQVRWVHVREVNRTVAHYPCVVLHREEIPLTSCGSSGAALQELYDVLVEFRDVEEDVPYLVDGEFP
jgi:hypothetical protein